MAEMALQAEPLFFDDVPVADLGTISIRVFVLPPKPKKGKEKEEAKPEEKETAKEEAAQEKEEPQKGAEKEKASPPK